MTFGGTITHVHTLKADLDNGKFVMIFDYKNLGSTTLQTALMYNDDKKYIHQRPEIFKKWFENEYPDEEYLGKFRTFDELRDASRYNNYQSSIEWLNQ